MITRQRTQHAIAVAVTDVLAVTGAFFGAYWLRFVFQIRPVRDLPSDIPTYGVYLPILLTALFVVPLVLSAAGLYRVRRTNGRVEVYIRVAGAITFAIVMVAALISLFYRPEEFIPVAIGPGTSELVQTELVRVSRFNMSRLFLGLFWLGAIGLSIAGRMLVQAWVDRLRLSGQNLKRVLIAGTGPLAQTVVDKVRLHEEFGFDIVGMLGDRPDAASYRGVEVVGDLADARHVVADRQVDQLYVALPLSAHEDILTLLRQVNHEIIEVKVVPDLLQYITLGAGVEDLDGVPIVNLSRIPMQGFPAALKRGLDIVASGAAILLFLPLLPIIALAVKLTSPGPVFFRQKRMGLDGRSFNILKFRSMVVDAEKLSGPKWADEHDARCTPIGAFLRKLSLDELPQFFNVFRGDMSLVGPRPERPYFVDEFRHRIPHYMLRHRVRAGLTGWAQVHGWRGNTSLEKRIEYDLYYIENWSLALDLKILWMTVTNGMVHEHAY